MNKLLPLMVFVVAASATFAQVDPPKVSAATKAYGEYRLGETLPSYRLRKISALVKKIKRDADDNEPMDAKTYNSLNFSEKFTYAMIHGEDASQNCDDMPDLVGEEHFIFCYVRGAFDEQEAWSKRQLQFLHDNRTKVIALLRSNMRRSHRVGANFKQAITELSANEMIPDVFAVYKRDHKDQDILTICTQLMKDGNYKPFLASPIYKKLYGNKMNYQAHIEASPANCRAIISNSMSFYRSRTR